MRPYSEGEVGDGRTCLAWEQRRPNSGWHRCRDWPGAACRPNMKEHFTSCSSFSRVKRMRVRTVAFRLAVPNRAAQTRQTQLWRQAMTATGIPRSPAALVSLFLAGAFVFSGLSVALADEPVADPSPASRGWSPWSTQSHDTFAAQGQPSRGWKSCSHLSPWNGVEFSGGGGAVVIKTWKLNCRKAAKKLSRAKLDRSNGTVHIRKWRCRRSGTFYEGSYTTCVRKAKGRSQRVRILAEG
jgi:hypothetical protein